MLAVVRRVKFCFKFLHSQKKKLSRVVGDVIKSFLCQSLEKKMSEGKWGIQTYHKMEETDPESFREGKKEQDIQSNKAIKIASLCFMLFYQHLLACFLAKFCQELTCNLFRKSWCSRSSQKEMGLSRSRWHTVSQFWLIDSLVSSSHTASRILAKPLRLFTYTSKSVIPDLMSSLHLKRIIESK